MKSKNNLCRSEHKANVSHLLPSLCVYVEHSLRQVHLPGALAAGWEAHRHFLGKPSTYSRSGRERKRCRLETGGRHGGVDGGKSEREGRVEE